MSPTCLAGIRHANGELLGLFDEGIAEVVIEMALMTLLISAIFAPFAIRRYTSLVRRLMRLRPVSAIPVVRSLIERIEHDGTLDRSAHGSIDGISFEALELASQSRLTNLQCATWSAYGVYVALSIAILMIGGMSPGSSAAIGGDVLIIAASALIPALINLRRTVPGWVTTLAVSVVVIGGVLLDEDPTPTALEDIAYGIGGVLMILSLYFVFVRRALRNIVFPTMVFVAVVLPGVWLAMWQGGALVECSRAGVGSFEQSLGLMGTVLGGFIFATFVLVASKTVGGIARLQERGIGSDISLGTVSGLVLTATLAAFIGSDDEGKGGPSSWLLLSAAMGCIAIAIAIYCWLVRRGGQIAAQRSLLILRVFSKDRAAEQLLDEIQTRWRYVGPVYQIGGPDLSRLNINAYGFAKFLASKLQDVFLFDSISENQLRAHLDRVPDREGRFRVNELFCIDSVWRSVVEQLIGMSDAILLDLRGFNPERSGTSFEVDLLARRGRLPDVVAFGDRHTDWSHFEALVRDTSTRCGVLHRDTSTTSAAELVTALMHASVSSIPIAAREVGLALTNTQPTT